MISESSAADLYAAERRRHARDLALLVVLSHLYVFVTGVSLFEGHVVYRSWMNLASFSDVASASVVAPRDRRRHLTVRCQEPAPDE